MKYIVRALCIVLCVICALSFIAYIIGFRINFVDDSKAPAKLHYVDNKSSKEICIELSDNETEQILNIIEKEIAIPDKPSCPFMKEISFEIAGKHYLPALDDCCLLQIDNTGRYIRISADEKHLLQDIIEKYMEQETAQNP